MSTKGNLTRAEAVAIVGEATVAKVDSRNCDFTNRVQCDGDTRVEFSASTCNAKDTNGDDCTLVAYYYQEQADLDGVDDLSSLDWTVHGYEVV